MRGVRDGAVHCASGADEPQLGKIGSRLCTSKGDTMDSIQVTYSEPGLTAAEIYPAFLGDQPVWEMLHYFTEPKFVAQRIGAIHGAPGPSGMSAADRSDWVSHSVLQAKDYFDAARLSSLSTSPLLLYYGARALAAALIALQHPDFAEFEPHHGLSFEQPPKRGARIHTKGPKGREQAHGTFGLLARLVWYDDVRVPVVGPHSSVTAPSDWALRRQFVPDWHLPYVDGRGTFDLATLFGEIPDMTRLARHHLPSRRYLIPARVYLARLGKVTRLYVGLEDASTPGAVVRAAKAMAAQSPAWRLTQLSPSACVLEQELSADLPEGVWPIRQGTDGRTYVLISGTCGSPPELCCYYVASYILGMLARYHAREWRRDIQPGSPRLLSITRFVELAVSRLPLLFLRALWGGYVGPE